MQTHQKTEGTTFLKDRFPLDTLGMVGDLYNLDVYVNGEFLRGEHARLPVWDHGLLYGDGVFEGIRAYRGGIFKLDEHINRLLDSARAIQLYVPLGHDEIRMVVIETLRRNSLHDAHIRVIVTRGSGKPGLDPRRSTQASFLVMAYPFPPMLGDQPVRLISSSIRRKSPYAVDSRVKSLNYLDNILAKLQAIAAGMDDAIMLDINSYAAEGTGENVFGVKHGVLFTPTLAAALPGITRATIISIALELGNVVQERNITLGDLYTADEIFLTGTGAEIVPVIEMDGRRIGNGEVGNMTTLLKDRYQDCINSGKYTTWIYPEGG